MTSVSNQSLNIFRNHNLIKQKDYQRLTTKTTLLCKKLLLKKGQKNNTGIYKRVYINLGSNESFFMFYMERNITK